MDTSKKNTENMLGSYGPWVADRMPQVPGDLSLLNGRWTDVNGWRDAARARFTELTGLDRVRDCEAPAAVVRDCGEIDGLRYELLEWRRPAGPPTSAVFLKPAGSAGRLPAVLAFHDHGGVKHIGREKIAQIDVEVDPFVVSFRERYYGGRAWANELARRGYAVLVPDAFLFGSRRVNPSELPGYVAERLMSKAGAPELLPEDTGGTPVMSFDLPPAGRASDERISAYNSFAAEHESIVAKSLFSAGLSWPAMFLADDMAALSYLAAREDVDPSRIGCGGLSGGGLRTNYLAGMDDRIACSVTAGFMTTWRDFVLHTSHTHTWMIYVPGLPRYMDYPEILAMRAPLPSLVLSNFDDPLFTPGETARARATLEQVFEKSGGADRFRMTLYPGPHKFDCDMQEEAFAWLDRWLG